MELWPSKGVTARSKVTEPAGRFVAVAVRTGQEGALLQPQLPVWRPAWLGERLPHSHIKPMPHKGSSPRTLDLFEVTLTVPTPLSEAVSSPAQSSEPASLSDAQLATRLGQLVEEVRGRLEAGRGQRPELTAAVRQARLSLDRLVPRSAKRDKHLGSGKSSPTLQEGQRKAVRAALVAGVAPTQVAKHFGLSLAAIRKVLHEAG
jgi:hypothetical protein